MKIDEFGTHTMSLEEFNSLFGCTYSFKSVVRCMCTTECIQDIISNRKQLFAIRSSGEITQDEIEDYAKFDQQLNSFDLDELRTRVSFIRDDVG
jgi:hypothetical protein